ncbi:MAG: polyprenyl synthetase family protein [Phycisphaerae bacterium]
MTRQSEKLVHAEWTLRRELERLSESTARDSRLVPPLSLSQLRPLARNVLREAGASREWLNYVLVMLSNAAWRDSFADVPMNKRLLLLPQCLRPDRHACPAENDAFGLLCTDCGRCSIGELRAVAESLGYVVLVAEGTTAVTSLIADGHVEAILGVSCMSVLEKVFPYIQAAAIPGIAIPLLTDGCDRTEVDMDSVYEAINLTGDGSTRRLNLEPLRAEVSRWFTEEGLDALAGPVGSDTERIARDWLLAGGKRWRPFLTCCTFQALRTDGREQLPPALKKIAVAVECFHKASLIHDDIEDSDDYRYGRETLHRKHGVPVALNAGDMLIGEGYRLLTECGLDAPRTAQMVQTAAAAHRLLCSGQGDELSWARRPGPLPVRKVLDIFRRKTSPSFCLAMQLGAVCASADEQVRPHLHSYCDALGIAYQIRDDLKDLSGGAGDLDAGRLSVVTAVAWQRGDRDQQEQLQAALREPAGRDGRAAKLSDLLAGTRAVETAERLLQLHKRRAIRSLDQLQSAPLKALMRRVLGKIFADIKEPYWCADDSTANAPVGGPGPQQTA